MDPLRSVGMRPRGTLSSVLQDARSIVSNPTRPMTPMDGSARALFRGADFSSGNRPSSAIPDALGLLGNGNGPLDALPRKPSRSGPLAPLGSMPLEKVKGSKKKSAGSSSSKSKSSRPPSGRRRDVEGDVRDRGDRERGKSGVRSSRLPNPAGLGEDGEGQLSVAGFNVGGGSGNNSTTSSSLAAQVLKIEHPSSTASSERLALYQEEGEDIQSSDEITTGPPDTEVAYRDTESISMSTSRDGGVSVPPDALSEASWQEIEQLLRSIRLRSRESLLERVMAAQALAKLLYCLAELRVDLGHRIVTLSSQQRNAILSAIYPSFQAMEDNKLLLPLCACGFLVIASRSSLSTLVGMLLTISKSAGTDEDAYSIWTQNPLMTNLLVETLIHFPSVLMDETVVILAGVLKNICMWPTVRAFIAEMRDIQWLWDLGSWLEGEERLRRSDARSDPHRVQMQIQVLGAVREFLRDPPGTYSPSCAECCLPWILQSLSTFLHVEECCLNVLRCLSAISEVDFRLILSALHSLPPAEDNVNFAATMLGCIERWRSSEHLVSSACYILGNLCPSVDITSHFWEGQDEAFVQTMTVTLDGAMTRDPAGVGEVWPKLMRAITNAGQAPFLALSIVRSPLMAMLLPPLTLPGCGDELQLLSIACLNNVASSLRKSASSSSSSLTEVEEDALLRLWAAHLGALVGFLLSARDKPEVAVEAAGCLAALSQWSSLHDDLERLQCWEGAILLTPLPTDLATTASQTDIALSVSCCGILLNASADCDRRVSYWFPPGIEISSTPAGELIPALLDTFYQMCLAGPIDAADVYIKTVFNLMSDAHSESGKGVDRAPEFVEEVAEKLELWQDEFNGAADMRSLSRIVSRLMVVLRPDLSAEEPDISLVNEDSVYEVL